MRVLVAGVGNVLKGDDGFGVEALAALQKRGGLPPSVTLLDTGIGGIHLVQELGQGYGALILLDAMDRGGKPGDLFLVEPVLPDPDTMSDRERRDFFADVHYATPVRAMTLARAVGALPPIVRIIGCQPLDAETFGQGMTASVREAVPRAVEFVDRVLREMAGLVPP